MFFSSAVPSGSGDFLIPTCPSVGVHFSLKVPISEKRFSNFFSFLAMELRWDFIYQLSRDGFG
jgi:hypothetical protein